MSMSAARSRFSLFTTPSKTASSSSQASENDIEPWFVPPTPPQQQPQQQAQSTTASESYEERLLALKDRLDPVLASSHHLTSVINLSQNAAASASSSLATTLLPNMANTAASFSAFLSSAGEASSSSTSNTSTIIPAVSFRDFDSFLTRAKSKSGKTFTPHREFVPSKPFAHAESIPQEEMLRECYGKVPEEFFERTFDVYANNATIDEFIDQSFALLRERQEREEEGGSAALPSSPQEAITKLRIKSERVLSSQLDLVETCLFNETMTRKDAIFQTIANLHNLQCIVAEESARVGQLRASMAKLKSVTTAGRDEVLQFTGKMDQANTVLHLLDAICKAREGGAALDLMMRSNDHTAAFLLIEDSLVALEGELNGLFALRTMTRQFREFKETTGNAMSDSFMRVATADLFPNAASNAAPAPSAGEDGAEMAIKLMPWMRGMLKRGNARACLNLYKLEMQRTLKSSSEIVVTSFFSKEMATQQQRDVSAEAEKRFKEMRAMELSEFFLLMQHLFEAVDLVLARAKLVDVSIAQHVLPRLVDAAQISHRDCAELTAYSRDCLAQINKTSAELFARILQLRADFHQSRLSPLEFKMVYDLFEPRLTGAGGAQVLNVQLEQLIAVQHERMQKQIVHALDEAETWEAVTLVPKHIQHIVNVLERRDAKLLFDNATLAQEEEMEEDKYLSVPPGPRKLRVLQSSLEMIRILQDYLRLATITPHAAWMCVGRMFDCVILFDERLRRLILGTEVKQKKKLAVIGAKNLALTLQSVVALHQLLPSIAALCCGAVKPEMVNRVRDELVSRMDKALADHELALVDTLKLLVTMELNRVAKHVEEGEGFDWDAGGTEGLDSAQEYMVAFAGKIDRLYSVLVVNLDRESLILVFTRVLKLIDERMMEIMDKAKRPPKTPAGMMRVKMDILHLVASLRKLKFLQGQGLAPGDVLEDWVNEKYSVKSSTAAAVPPAHNSTEAE